MKMRWGWTWINKSELIQVNGWSNMEIGMIIQWKIVVVNSNK